LIYLKQIFLQNKPYQQILLKIKEYCGKWQNLICEECTAYSEKTYDLKTKNTKILLLMTKIHNRNLVCKYNFKIVES